MYLLNRRCWPGAFITDTNLHSTMYLLNPIKDNRGTMFFTNLHSTMYLLNPEAQWDYKYLVCKFTFHYVSIKSALSLIDYCNYD